MKKGLRLEVLSFWNQRCLVVVKHFTVATPYARAKMRGMNTTATHHACLFEGVKSVRPLDGGRLEIDCKRVIVHGKLICEQDRNLQHNTGLPEEPRQPDIEGS
ncbi:hypothetical protein [Limnohabitans sp.]|uniref:hypothetical protein n=1 Tax=Limnohabitans sp. TaxID=1907725 RepID=UPI00286F8700|nr:hypothetical protein [Limnohabitans sp.]